MHVLTYLPARANNKVVNACMKYHERFSKIYANHIVYLSSLLVIYLAFNGLTFKIWSKCCDDFSLSSVRCVGFGVW